MTGDGQAVTGAASGAANDPATPAGPTAPTDATDERRRRWRLLLGPAAESDLGGLSTSDEQMDSALTVLYDRPDASTTGSPGAGGGLGSSAPGVARWLGDIRRYFPTSVVQVMQQDAIDRLGLRQLLLEKEMLAAVTPDVALVSTLVGLNRLIPETTKATARQVVGVVVAEVERRIANKTRAAVSGALNRSTRQRRPKYRDIDWNRTIAANLTRYLPEYKTVVPERLIGYGRNQRMIAKDIVLAIDQSGSMANSVVYSSVFGAVLASIRSVKTSLVFFDTAVVDMTETMADPVEVLFGTQLGGGTDINQAIGYCRELITRPRDSIFVLISDLIEGGVRDQMLARVAEMVASGITVIALLALSDEGAPTYDHDNAAALAGWGIPAFACTPDQFPELLSVAIEGGDIAGWVDRRDLAAR